MRSIVIVPHTLLGSPITAAQTDHLLLSHFVKASSWYRDFYRERREMGDYLILDNSAHEFGHGESIDTLLEQGSNLRAQEIVLPDVLFSSEGTIDRTWEAIRFILKHRDLPENMPTSWMVVPQGCDFLDWNGCLSRLMLLWETAKARRPEIFEQLVIGLSKDYSETFGTLDDCFTNVFAMKQVHRAQVHLLGWPKPLYTLPAIAQKYGNQIRTTDSSRPATFAMHGIGISHGLHHLEYPGRPENFFDFPLTDDFVDLAYRNSCVYRDLVRLGSTARNVQDSKSYSSEVDQL